MIDQTAPPCNCIDVAAAIDGAAVMLNRAPHTILGYNSPTETPRAGSFWTEFQKMATATIQSFVDAITAKAAAETAVGTILSAIQQMRAR
jgi:hypothetical protein